MYLPKIKAVTALICLFSLIASTAGCSINSATGNSDFIVLSKALEDQIGKDEHPKIIKQFGGVYKKQDISAYVAVIGGKLAAVTERPDITFTFTVLDSQIVNAFTTPGGYIYITRGLVALANTEAQLASVIGHELGHAIVGYECKESDPLHKISIVSRGQSLGVTWFLPKEDQFTTSKTKFLDEICGLLGGRAAEELIYKEMTTGASNDIERASAIARNMAMRYGMAEGDLGPVAYGEKQGGYLGTDGAMTRNFSEEKAKQIDSFVKKTVDAQYARALTILKKNKTKLEKLTTVLLKTETMTVEEFMVIYTGKKQAKKK